MTIHQTNPDGVRMVQFPPNPSLGAIQVRDWGISGGWQLLQEARGTVMIPIGKEVRLTVHPTVVADLSALRSLQLDDIQWLDLSKTAVEDEQLRHLANMTLLRRLDLRSTPVGDRALMHIAHLSSIKELRLNGTKVSDDGLVHLRSLAKLVNLWLYDTTLTDAAVAHLKAIPSLEVLQLPRQISHVAQAELKHALPECYINVQR